MVENPSFRWLRNAKARYAIVVKTGMRSVEMMLLHKRLTVELATPAGTFLRIRRRETQLKLNAASHPPTSLLSFCYFCFSSGGEPTVYKREVSPSPGLGLSGGLEQKRILVQRSINSRASRWMRDQTLSSISSRFLHAYNWPGDRPTLRGDVVDGATLGKSCLPFSKIFYPLSLVIFPYFLDQVFQR